MYKGLTSQNLHTGNLAQGPQVEPQQHSQATVVTSLALCWVDMAGNTTVTQTRAQSVTLVMTQQGWP